MDCILPLLNLPRLYEQPTAMSVVEESPPIGNRILLRRRRPLLDYLYHHLVRPEFTCRFRWSVNAIAFWDNRCVQHYAINDYHGQRRVMHRVTVDGDRAVRGFSRW